MWEGFKGNLVDASGNTVDVNVGTDDEGDLKEAISDTNVPEPPEDSEEDAEQDNDMESEGLTNEEAGLENSQITVIPSGDWTYNSMTVFGGIFL